MADGSYHFDPRAILGALERSYVDYVVIGGLARVLRGACEITHGVDICPSFAANNLERLAQAARELEARTARRGQPAFNESALATEEPIGLKTTFGELKIAAAPAGVPSGFVDLRRTATREDLGHGVRPQVASTADLARMTASLHRAPDIERLRALRRIMELEVTREPAVVPAVRGASRDRLRAAARERGPGPGRGLER